MSLVPVKYPLDVTGAAASNRVTDELHQLASTNVRVFVPRYGAFFTDSIAVRDASTNRTLRKGVDYYPSLLYTLPTEQTGREIHQLIVIVDASCGPNILFDGQMLGGEYSYSYDAIIQLVQRLGLDGRPIEFDNIIGKPDGYNPAPHLHDAGDIYGMEYLAASLDRVRDSILLGSAAGQKSVYDYLENRLVELRKAIDYIRDSRASAKGIITSLGYTPMDERGGAFKGPVILPHTYSKGVHREIVKKYDATATTTALDLNAGNHFVVTLGVADTALRFDVSTVEGLSASDYIKFTLYLRNGVTAGRKVTWSSKVIWPGKTEPQRATTINAIHEYEFSTYDGGVTWNGKLIGSNLG